MKNIWKIAAVAVAGVVGGALLAAAVMFLWPTPANEVEAGPVVYDNWEPIVEGDGDEDGEETPAPVDDSPGDDGDKGEDDAASPPEDDPADPPPDEVHGPSYLKYENMNNRSAIAYDGDRIWFMVQDWEYEEDHLLWSMENDGTDVTCIGDYVYSISFHADELYCGGVNIFTVNAKTLQMTFLKAPGTNFAAAKATGGEFIALNARGGAALYRNQNGVMEPLVHDASSSTGFLVYDGRLYLNLYGKTGIYRSELNGFNQVEYLNGDIRDFAVNHNGEYVLYNKEPSGFPPGWVRENILYRIEEDGTHTPLTDASLKVCTFYLYEDRLFYLALPANSDAQQMDLYSMCDDGSDELSHGIRVDGREGWFGGAAGDWICVIDGYGYYQYYNFRGLGKLTPELTGSAGSLIDPGSISWSTDRVWVGPITTLGSGSGGSGTSWGEYAYYPDEDDWEESKGEDPGCQCEWDCSCTERPCTCGPSPGSSMSGNTQISVEDQLGTYAFFLSTMQKYSSSVDFSSADREKLDRYLPYSFPYMVSSRSFRQKHGTSMSAGDLYRYFEYNYGMAESGVDDMGLASMGIQRASDRNSYSWSPLPGLALKVKIVDTQTTGSTAVYTVQAELGDGDDPSSYYRCVWKFTAEPAQGKYLPLLVTKAQEVESVVPS